MSDWPHTHVEMVSPARTLLLKQKGPWIFDGVERFPALGDLTARVQIGDFEELGRTLVIDGTVQITEVIDPLYTTALVFPAALLADSRKRWLIVGGGDGATPREALRFRDTESVQLVDISRMVIERTQELIPSFWAGCQHDPRLSIQLCDAWMVLKDMAARKEQVDILLYDLSDPGAGLEGCNPFTESSSDHLYTQHAFQTAAQCLAPGGIFVAQVAELSLLRYETHRNHRKALSRVFRHVHSYRTHIEPFGYSESWILASNREDAFHPTAQVDIDDRLAALYVGDGAGLYSAAWHNHLFTLPPPLQPLLR